MFENEHWKPVPRFKGRYSSSDKGRFRSEPRVVRGKDGVDRKVAGKILKISLVNLESPFPTTRVQFFLAGKSYRYTIPYLYYKIWGKHISTTDVLVANEDTLPNGLPVVSENPYGVFSSSHLAGQYFGGSAPTVRASVASGRPAMFHNKQRVQFRLITPEERLKYKEILMARSYFVD